jgi:hypothetical protein
VSYKHNKAWRQRHPDRRNAQRARYYSKTAASAGAVRRRRWDHVQDRAILTSGLTDTALAAEMGRSVAAIQIRRCRLVSGLVGSSTESDATDVPGESCVWCARKVVVVWNAPSALWAAVMKSSNPNAVICPECFHREANERGVPVWFAAQPHTAAPCNADSLVPMSKA